VTRLADRVAVLKQGRIAREGLAASLAADPARLARHPHV